MNMSTIIVKQPLYYLQDNNKSKNNKHDVRERKLPQKLKSSQCSLSQD